MANQFLQPITHMNIGQQASPNASMVDRILGQQLQQYAAPAPAVDTQLFEAPRGGVTAPISAGLTQIANSFLAPEIRKEQQAILDQGANGRALNQLQDADALKNYQVQQADKSAFDIGMRELAKQEGILPFQELQAKKAALFQQHRQGGMAEALAGAKTSYETIGAATNDQVDEYKKGELYTQNRIVSLNSIGNQQLRTYEQATGTDPKIAEMFNYTNPDDHMEVSKILDANNEDTGYDANGLYQNLTTIMGGPVNSKVLNHAIALTKSNNYFHIWDSKNEIDTDSEGYKKFTADMLDMKSKMTRYNSFTAGVQKRIGQETEKLNTDLARFKEAQTGNQFRRVLQGQEIPLKTFQGMNEVEQAQYEQGLFPDYGQDTGTPPPKPTTETDAAALFNVSGYKEPTVTTGILGGAKSAATKFQTTEAAENNNQVEVPSTVSAMVNSLKASSTRIQRERDIGRGVALLDRIEGNTWTDEQKRKAAENNAITGRNDTPDDLAVSGSIYDKITKAESSNNPNAKNSNSSAKGLVQFTDTTWINTVKQNYPELKNKSNAELIALQKDPTLYSEMGKTLTNANTKGLRQAGITPTDANIYAAHFLGLPTATALLTANRNQTVDKILSKDKLIANASIVKRNGKYLTVGQLRDWTESKMA